MQEPVAIVGLAALLPGSPSVAQFWRVVVGGRDLMTDVPASRWLIEDHYDADPRAVDKTYGRRGAFLPDVDFDPLRYGIPPNNLPAIDTSQLLALVVAERVLADCTGRPVDPERVSVLIGASSLERMVEASARLQRPVWLRVLREHGVPDDAARSICDQIAAHYVPWQEETFPGLLTNVVAGRIANRFDLRGMNHTTDAACASSLAAVYNGIAELSLGGADLVITGGVDTMNDVTMYTCFTRTPALSPTGDCRPFAADADGTMLGEGLVLFALKRLSDAERDGDGVYAVIRGVGASSDGRGAAIYAPVPDGQSLALRRAYAAAGYGPETVELVEAHGTGTSAGDTAEFAALREVFGTSGRADRQWCALGSVKSQIGHTKSAAGAAGLLKAVLAVHHKVLPPTIKVDRPHPELDLARSPFYLNTSTRPWVRADGTHPRRASVSSFGFGGTNFHCTVEEYPGGAVRRMPAAPTELILLGAESIVDLRARISRLDPSGELADLAGQTRAEFDPAAPVRLAVVASDPANLSAKLAEAVTSAENGQPPGPHLQAYLASGPASSGLVGFLFPGQGAQYVGMGGDLAVHLSPARGPWDRAAGLDFGGGALHRLVFPPPAFTDAERAEQQAALTATEWAQPALAVHSLALLAVLDAVGLAADCLAGHSFGELVALHAAGAFDADALVRLARRRGELMAGESARGAMLAVASDRATVTAVIAGRPDVWLANHNGSRQVVVAGTVPAVDAVAGLLVAQGIGTTRLNTATAFHTPLVAPACEPLFEYLRGVDVRPPRQPVFGNADALEYPADPDAVRDRVSAQLAQPVAFLGVVEAMYAAGVRTFVEVGAGAALSGLVGQILGQRPHLAVPLDRRGRHGLTTLQEGLGRLAVHGVAMDLAALSAETDTPAAAGNAPLSRSSVRINGGNYGRPYPPAAGGPPPPPPAVPVPSPRPAEAPAPVPHAPPPSTMDAGWLRVVEDAQRQMAEAQSAFQRAMADSHMAYLRMAETTMAGLLGTTAGELPAGPPPGAPEPVEAPPSARPVLAPPMVAPPSPPPSRHAPALVSTVDANPTAPVVERTTAPPGGPPADDVAGLLLSVVAERTGYPVEILDLDMALDTDLGIDSIKRVEILSSVRDRVGDVPTDELSALTTLRTLREIADRFAGSPAMGGNTPPADAVRPPPEPTSLARRTVRPVAAPPSGLAMAGLTAGTVAVTDDGRGIAPLVVAGLRHHGVHADVVTRVPADAGGVILLDGLRTVTSPAAATELQLASLRATSTVARRMEAAGGVFVTVQDTGADFGLATPADAPRAWLGGLAALARTAAKEWPKAAVKAIDCATAGRPAAAVADAIVAELLGGAGASEVGLRADGTRVVPELRDTPFPGATDGATDGGAGGRARIGPHSVIVATGGARGITAAALGPLARRHRPRLVLLGRTRLPVDGGPPDEPPAVFTGAAADDASLLRLLAAHRAGSPAELAARARRIRAIREIRDTLDGFERDGVPVRYVPVDVRDAGAVAGALDAVRRDWGPVTAVVHGAGVVADARLSDKTGEQVATVFGTKLDGLRALLAATADDPLDVLCAFSSVAAVFGNAGQADYAMANETLNQVLAAERARRPDCLVRAIAWGPWNAGMVTPTIADRFHDNGVPLIDPADGARAFVDELAGEPAGEVLVIRTADGAGPPPATPDTGVTAEVTVTEAGYRYLADHRVNGVAVVPVATVVGWFAGAARAWRPGAARIVLRDLRVLDKIALPARADGGHRLVLRGHSATAPDGPALDLDLRDGAGKPHYRASAAGPAADAVPPLRGDWPLPANLEPLDDPYGRTTLFHGPALRAVRGTPKVGSAGADGVIAGANVLGWPAGTGEVDVAAVDGALQLALLWARRAGAGDTLPMAVDEVRLHRRGAVDGEARAVVRAVRVDDAGAICDVALMDEPGLARVELLGVHLVRRPGS